MPFWTMTGMLLVEEVGSKDLVVVVGEGKGKGLLAVGVWVGVGRGWACLGEGRTEAGLCGGTGGTGERAEEGVLAGVLASSAFAAGCAGLSA